MAEEQKPNSGGNPSRQRSGVASFVVELADDGNRSITLDTLRLTLRGRWSAATLHQREDGGRDLGNAMAGMPDIPGLRIAVSPRDKTAVIFDPLEDDEELRERITSVMNRSTILKTRETIKAVKKQRHELSEDQLKTLCIELYRKVNGEGFGVHGVHVSAVMVKGEMPSERDINKLDGSELYEQWNEGRHPRYRQDVEEWEERLFQSQAG